MRPPASEDVPIDPLVGATARNWLAALHLALRVGLNGGLGHCVQGFSVADDTAAVEIPRRFFGCQLVEEVTIAWALV